MNTFQETYLDYMGEGATGFGGDIIAGFLAAQDKATRGTGHFYRGGRFRDDDPETKAHIAEKAGIDHFHRWMRDNPPANDLESEEAIGNDLNRAILEAPDFVKEDADAVIAGAYRAFAMGKGDFEKFQQRHALHKARVIQAQTNIAAEMNRLQSDIAGAVVRAVRIGPAPAQSAFLWANGALLARGGLVEPRDAAGQGDDGAGPEYLWQAIVAGLALLSGGCNPGDAENARKAHRELERHTVERQKMLHDQALRNGLDPDKHFNTGRRAEETERMERGRGSRKGLRERQRDQEREEAALDLMDRGLEPTRRKHGAPRPIVGDGPSEELRQRDSGQMRRNVEAANDIGDPAPEGGAGILFAAMRTAKTEKMAEAVLRILDETDALRRKSAASRKKRYGGTMSGFRSGALIDPMKWSEAFWD